MTPGMVFNEISMVQGGTLDKLFKTMGRFSQIDVPPNLNRGQFRASPVSILMILGPLLEAPQVSRTSLGWHWRHLWTSFFFQDFQGSPWGSSNIGKVKAMLAPTPRAAILQYYRLQTAYLLQTTGCRPVASNPATLMTVNCQLELSTNSLVAPKGAGGFVKFEGRSPL